MAYVEVDDGVELYYKAEGEGKPVIFIHGVWMSSRFFHKQMAYFKEGYRAITLDLRGHGNSSKVQSGHTVAQYAQDVKVFMEKLELQDVTLIGWSMGAFVIWEYLHQFGEDNIKASVIVDELASDFKWDDFDIGAFDLATLTSMMRDIQTDQSQLLEGFLPLMFKEDLSKEELRWMLRETMKVPASIASAILFDQSIIDCRPYFSSITLPTLLCFGRAEKLIPVAAGEHLHKEIPYSRLEVFEDSCHCPFLEEPERFNMVVDRYLQSL
ncbi:alpha/beta fold hydrolase [Pontibacillus yanchengensis]|uniref:Alpha/beta hydrolase n=1 Tax=Pontibacillus yanchengensis Y32 TaxID=1385514 RepID=A0A0A2TFX1_9BACI|nr:alpha/beta hydrolase [Pontibacillus yanchengensis]KGP74439.1 alpha/beta hydrolase [Pontibacillus yanchengensis Y32]